VRVDGEVMAKGDHRSTRDRIGGSGASHLPVIADNWPRPPIMPHSQRLLKLGCSFQPRASTGIQFALEAAKTKAQRDVVGDPSEASAQLVAPTR